MSMRVNFTNGQQLSTNTTSTQTSNVKKRETDTRLQDILSGKVDTSKERDKGLKKMLLNAGLEVQNSNEKPVDKMSKKDIKAWIKNYKKQNNCSKKEAKAEFQERFEKTPTQKMELGSVLNGIISTLFTPNKYSIENLRNIELDQN